MTWYIATRSQALVLGVRILGEVKNEFADLLRRADAIFIEELRNTIDEKTGKTWYELTSQAFTVFLPVKSVGVMGDGRTYDYVVALRAVVTSDFMTAHWAELPYALLGQTYLTVLSMKCVASTALFMIFLANRQQRLSGNNREANIYESCICK